MQIFIFSFNWQGCRKSFEIPLPTQLWGTIFTYTTLNYCYFSLARWCSLIQLKKHLYFVPNSTLSQGLFSLPWLSSSASPNWKSFTSGYTDNWIPIFICTWSFQGLPDNCKGVSTSLLVPNGSWFIVSSRAHPKELCQTLTKQLLSYENVFCLHWGCTFPTQNSGFTRIHQCSFWTSTRNKQQMPLQS